MRHSIFHCFLFALSACIAAFVHTFEPVAQAVYASGKFVSKVVSGVVRDSFVLFGGGSGCIDLNPISLFVKAKSFASRIEKRERPVITASWRMCASI